MSKEKIVKELSKVETKIKGSRAHPHKGGRPKGQPKTGGRQKGTQNKNKKVFRDALDEIGFDLVAETMLTLSKLENPKEKLDFMLRLFRYIYPTLKEVEVIERGNSITEDMSKLSDENLITLMKQAK